MKTKNFNPEKHIDNLTSTKYYSDLVLLRNDLEIGCDDYFQKLGAPKVDLYLISNSISSPVALGSDSKPIEFHLDKSPYFLADSSQFGMEPLLFNSFKMVYCYLPSFRGEDPNERHLNQFYHCEAELLGGYEKAMEIAEGLVKHLVKIVLKNRTELSSLLTTVVDKKFPKISFDEAVNILDDNKLGKLVEHRKYGRVLTERAEKEITRLVSDNKLPVWVTDYDRDTVAFYQKPSLKNGSKVLNSDLIVPPFTKRGFGGEILGLGQRQNKVEEIIESMNRQKIENTGQYDWYIKLRKKLGYRTTSGFGLGIERLISWTLGLENIADACLYPVLKGSKMQY